MRVPSALLVLLASSALNGQTIRDPQTESSAPTVVSSDSSVAVAPAGELRAVPLNSGVVLRQRTVMTPNATDVVASLEGDERLIYHNTDGRYVILIPAGFLVADDITTTAADGCKLRRFSFEVTGNAEPGGEVGPFCVTYALYFTCPAAFLPNASPSRLIVGTLGTIEFEDEGTFKVDVTFAPESNISLRTTMWLALTFSRPNGGIIAGAPAAQGFSADAISFPALGCSSNFGGYPVKPHASFNIEVFGDPATCSPVHVDYKNTREEGPPLNLGANQVIVDDLQLLTPDCLMIGYEVALRGRAAYDIELRRGCGGDGLSTEWFPSGTSAAIPGTYKKMNIGSSSSGTRRRRIPIDPPVPAGGRLWVAVKVNNPTGGPIRTGIRPFIGDNDFPIWKEAADGTCEVAELISPNAYGALDVTIICAGDAPTGACCDGAYRNEQQERESVCRDFAEVNCTPPAVWRERATCESACVGGERDGLSCTVTGDCPGGSCDGPFPAACGLWACCTDDGTCENMTEADCAARSTLGEEPKFSLGKYCDVDIDACPLPACVGNANTCTLPDAGVCVGGSDDGKECLLSAVCDSSTCCSNGGTCEKTRGCADEGCCTRVCTTEGYAHCCEVEWDDSCAEAATTICHPSHRIDECSSARPGDGARQLEMFGSTSVSFSVVTSGESDPAVCCHPSEVGGPVEATAWFKFVAPAAVTQDDLTSAVRATFGGTPGTFLQFFESTDVDRGICRNGSACSLSAPSCADDSRCEVDEEFACGNLSLIACNSDGDVCVDGLVPGRMYFVMFGAVTASNDNVTTSLALSPGCSPIPSASQPDCNGDGTPDVCELPPYGADSDCDNDGNNDSCAVDDEIVPDCNANGVPDSCDIAGGESPDCNTNGVPDECDGDCNDNGVPDACDLASGFSADCNNNNWPDECDDHDCDDNGVPDLCQMTNPDEPDCNGDSRPDVCGVLETCKTDMVSEPESWNGYFGASVAFNGKRVAVLSDRGTVYIYRIEGTKLIEEAAILTPGESWSVGKVAIDGDRLVVGDAQDERLHYYELAAGEWVFRQTLREPDSLETRYGFRSYGASFGLHETTLLVGDPAARPWDGKDNAIGVVVSYRIEGDAWVRDGLIVPSQDRVLDDFGHGVALDDNTIVVSSVLHYEGFPTLNFYDRTPSGWRSAGDAVVVATPLSGSWPSVLRVSGQVAILSVPSPPAVEVFENSAAGWAHTATIHDDTGQSNSGFAFPAHTDGTTIAIAAPNFDRPECRYCGAVFLYRNEGQGRKQVGVLLGDDEFGGDFGRSVAMTNDLLVVGEPYRTCLDPYGRGQLCGAAHVYSFGGADCDCNGAADVCEIESGVLSDCNNNVIPDVCDLDEGTSSDCDENMVPDECDVGCNANDIPDACDISDETSLDCNTNEVPDECEIDCNENGVPDDCDVADGTSDDCNADKRPDECGVILSCESPPQQKLTAQGIGLEDRFGLTVSVDGDFAFVGSPLDACEAGDFCGSVQIFKFNGSEWEFEATLRAPDAAEGDEFGFSVAIEGDTALIGAPRVDCETRTDCGAVYVYRYIAGSWVHDGRITRQEVLPTRFGVAVALSGPVAIVGTAGTFYDGAAYAYRFDGSDWVQEAKFVSFESGFGSGVGVDGHVAIIGGGGRTTAHIYRYVKDTWRLDSRLEPLALDENFLMGVAVAISGDIAIVGAQSETCNGQRNCGSAFVYRYDGRSWVEEAKLTPNDEASHNHFGVAVNFHRDNIVVSAFNTRDGGAVYTFIFDGSSWVQEHRYTAVNSAGWFGGVISVSDDVLLVGTRSILCRTQQDETRSQCDDVYILSLTGDDCNCDGVADTCEGDVCYSALPCDCNGNGQPDECDVDECDGDPACFDCNENGRPDPCDLEASRVRVIGSGLRTGDEFGDAIGLHGEWLVVGAPGDDVRGFQSGNAFVFRNIDGEWAQETTLLGSNVTSQEFFGRSAAVYGDWMAIGAPWDDCNSITYRCGATYLFHFQNGSWQPRGFLTLFDQDNGSFGTSVAMDGEWVVSGEPEDGNDRGFVHAARLPDAGPGHSQAMFPDSPDAGCRLGASVDVAAGRIVGGGPRCNVAYVFAFNGDEWVREARLTSTTPGGFGSSVAIADNLVVVGAPTDTEGGESAGAVYVYELVSGQWTLVQKLFSPGRRFGSSVEATWDRIYATSGDGAVIVFRRDARGWILHTILEPTNSTDFSSFGYALAVDGERIAIGARKGKAEFYPESGAAYVYEIRSLDCDHNGVPDECQDDCNGNGQADACEIVDCDGTPSCADCDGDRVLDLCESDLDGDAFIDDCDACPESRLAETITIGRCDSGVANALFSGGCTMADAIAECIETSGNYGDFVTCAKEVARLWMADGSITSSEQGAIVFCAKRFRPRRFGPSVERYKGPTGPKK